jgi:amino acid transporter
MSRLLSKVLYAVSVGIGVALFAAGFMAYFIRTFDPETGITSDGLGRMLLPTPWIAKFVFGEDSDWAGWAWFGMDFVIFWGVIGIIAFIYKGAEKLGGKVTE